MITEGEIVDIKELIRGESYFATFEKDAKKVMICGTKLKNNMFCTEEFYVDDDKNAFYRIFSVSSGKVYDFYITSDHFGIKKDALIQNIVENCDIVEDENKFNLVMSFVNTFEDLLDGFTETNIETKDIPKEIEQYVSKLIPLDQALFLGEIFKTSDLMNKGKSVTYNNESFASLSKLFRAVAWSCIQTIWEQ